MYFGHLYYVFNFLNVWVANASDTSEIHKTNTNLMFNSGLCVKRWWGRRVCWMKGLGCTCMRSVLAIRGIYLSKALTKEPIHGGLPARLIVTVPSFTVPTAAVLQAELIHLIQGISAQRWRQKKKFTQSLLGNGHIIGKSRKILQWMNKKGRALSKRVSIEFFKWYVMTNDKFNCKAKSCWLWI